jgi:hypothetical protein
MRSRHAWLRAARESRVCRKPEERATQAGEVGTCEAAGEAGIDEAASAFLNITPPGPGINIANPRAAQI